MEAITATSPSTTLPPRESDRAAAWWRWLESQVSSDRTATLTVFALAALVFMPRLGSVGLWDPWETHYAEVAREMLVRRDFVHPHWESAYFFSKPAFPLWLMALGMAFFGAEPYEGEGPLGSWVEWGVRLPNALIAIFTVWAVYRMGRRVAGRITGLVCALVVATCPQFIFIGKQAMADMPFVGLMTIGLAFFIDAVFGSTEENEAPAGPGLRYGSALGLLSAVGIQVLFIGMQSTSTLGWVGLAAALFGAGAVAMLVVQRGRVRESRLVLFYVLVGLAALSKGLAPLAVVGPTVLLYMLFARDWSLLARSGVLWGGPLFLLVASPWYVAMSLFPGRDDEGLTFVQRFWLHDNLNRVGSGVHGDRGGVGYYFEQLVYGMFPWFALVPSAILFAVSGEPSGKLDGKRKTLLFVTLWALWSYVFFSASQTKFHHYIFPAVPALAVLVGSWFSYVARDPGRRFGAFVFVPVAALLAAGAADLINRPQLLVNLFTYKYDRQYPLGLHAQTFLISFVAVSGALMVLAYLLRRRGDMQLAFLGLAVATGLWVSHHHFNMLSPHWSQYHLWKTYYAERRGHEPIYAYQLNWRGEAFYSRNRVLQVMRNNANQRIRELVEQPGREFIITEQGRYAALRSALPANMRTKLKILDQSNNHFYLMVVEE